MLDYDHHIQVAILRRKSLHPQMEETKQRLRFWKRLCLASALPLFLWCGYTLMIFIFSRASGQTHEWQYILLMGIILPIMWRHHVLEESMQNLSAIDSRLARASDDMKHLERLLEAHQPFVLYLRDFRTGCTRKEAIPPHDATFCGVVNVVWPNSYGSGTATLVLDSIQHHFPAVLLDSEGDRTPLKNGLIVYAEDATWEQDFQYLAEEAKYIVADFRLAEHGIAPGMRKELSFLLQTQLRKVILIGRAADVALLQAGYPELLALSVFVCTLPDNFDTKPETVSLTDLRRFFAANYPQPAESESNRDA
jgi:hypothetical protein